MASSTIPSSPYPTMGDTNIPYAESAPAAKAVPLPSAMTKDYADYFATSKPGDTRDWAGGKLTRAQFGSVFTDAQGNQTLLKPDSDLNALALSSPSISNVWGATYGWQPTAAEKETAPASSYTPSSSPAPSTTASLSATSDPTKTTAGTLTGLLSGNSPYIQSARTNALQTANSRGLLNSSIAAGAGEKAAIEAALPIAQNDASNYTQLLSNAQQGAIQSNLSSQQSQQSLIQQAQQYQQQAKLYELQGDIQAAAAASQQSNDLMKLAVTGQNQLDVTKLQGQNSQATAVTQAEQTRITNKIQNDWAGIQNQADQAIKTMDLDNTSLANFNNVMSTIQNNYTSSSNLIYSQPSSVMDDTTKQMFVDALKIDVHNQMTIASGVAGYTLTWDASGNAVLTKAGVS